MSAWQLRAINSQALVYNPDGDRDHHGREEALKQHLSQECQALDKRQHLILPGRIARRPELQSYAFH